jgi:uncharacterized protein (TIGR03435 family)
MLRANFVAALAVGVSWQHQANAQEVPPKFDVASVKVARPTERHGYNHTLTPGGVTMLGVSLGYCVRLAYGLSSIHPYELAGPIWMDPPTDVLVDIVAKTETPTSEGQVKLMLQMLLSERFKLAVHQEQREMAAYELRVISDSPALRKSTSGTERKMKPGKGREELFQNFSMADFALQLGPPLTTRPVVDKTGLDGAFDFRMDLGPYVTDPQTGALIVDAIGRVDTEGATFRALKDQLGLVLKPGHTLVNVLVIDHLEKTPSGN